MPLTHTHIAMPVILSVCLFLIPAVAAASPVIVHPAEQDRNFNNIDDVLEAAVAGALASGDPARPLRITAMLYGPPSSEDLRAFTQRQGRIIHRYEHAVYGFAGTIPANRIAECAQALGDKLCIMESDVPGRGTLDDSARQARARWLVWAPDSGYGYQGDRDIVIALFDTGIDTSHTDLSGGRLTYWYDFTDEDIANSTDRNGHGSHVAGIAAGSGASLGSGAITSITTTFSDRLPANGLGYADMIKVPVVRDGQVTSNLSWSGAGTARINLATSNATWFTGYNSATPPLSHTWTISSTDIYKAFAGNVSGLSGKAFSMLTTYPYDDVGDGYNLFKGMASKCRFACAKILDQTNSGWASDWTAAFDAIAAVNVQYNIKVANASVGLNNGATDALLHAAVNGLVSAGTVVVISAGNDYSSFTVPDPGLAEKAITVGAINDYSAMTQYSSNGPTNSIKPDVVAGGGSHSWNSDVGSEITSIDTNTNDGYSTMFSDRQEDDYCNLFGTSMAAPVVTGLAALIIQAMDDMRTYSWGFNEFEALEVKQIIQMTATETNKVGEESCGNNPALNRGGKDRVEGYGKVNADAAIEAVINWMQIPPETTFSVSFGNGDFDRKCWATSIGLCGPDSIILKLDVPATADYDLYLYSQWYTGDGEPVISYSSTQVGNGINERIGVVIGYMCAQYYLVAKRVSGYGGASMQVDVKTGTGIAEQNVPRTPELAQNYPNPFSGRTHIPFLVPGTGRQFVSLKLYDARGALVRTLIEEPVSAGERMTEWDGLDNGRQPVASGVYFARLNVMGQVRSRTINLVR